MEYTLNPMFIEEVRNAYSAPLLPTRQNNFGEVILQSADLNLRVSHLPNTYNWEVNLKFCDRKVFIGLNDTNEIIKFIDEKKQKLDKKMFQVHLFVKILNGKFNSHGVKNYIYKDLNKYCLGIVFGKNDLLDLARKSLLAFNPNEIFFWLKDESDKKTSCAIDGKTMIPRPLTR